MKEIATPIELFINPSKQPPPPAGYWIMGPLETPSGQVHFYTRKRPSWFVRQFARYMLNCQWVKTPSGQTFA